MELYNCPTIDYHKVVFDTNCALWMFEIFSRSTYWRQDPLYKAYWRISKPVVKKGRRLL